MFRTGKQYFKGKGLGISLAEKASVVSFLCLQNKAVIDLNVESGQMVGEITSTESGERQN